MKIKKFGKQLLEKLQNYDGMVDISSTLDPGIIELRLNIDRDKIASYGISPTVIAQTVSYYMLGGDKANTATLKTDSEEIDVLVRLPKEKRNDINTLSSFKILKLEIINLLNYQMLQLYNMLKELLK